jgi:hypothetical protein
MKCAPTVTARPALAVVLVSVLVSFSACSKKESLVLLDLRVSGPLGAPVASVRLSAPGGKTRVITGAVGPEGFRVGYYGPSDDGTLTVTAEALDGVGCVLGRGSATATNLDSGGTSAPTKLFIRPTPASGCAVVDAGGSGNDAATDTAPADSGTDTSSADAGTDTSSADTGTDTTTADTGAGDAPIETGGTDTSVDAGASDAPAEAPADTAGTDTSAADAGTDAPADAPSDTVTDATDDATTTDAGID